VQLPPAPYQTLEQGGITEFLALSTRERAEIKARKEGGKTMRYALVVLIQISSGLWVLLIWI
jgi:hypothetical protein